ncbi:MAG: DUF1028 domain-containing protein, partial [Actinobacteria bacterium]|nr:DUF1028 domain-containing protein [Actinomycetota bacterium]NIU19911.1 DUF1028 domain-containing protein [Actinomycetota bacterium]NIU67385.1 DUF1028 domain-containing protein [Actinomycetota bacterium]NIV56376.1 DUF1028 domain-containing protein [Actinomycetota bacterium]NIV87879.1 DUF1028 domain-containing protein [Actinomycetota bacterium]
MPAILLATALAAASIAARGGPQGHPAPGGTYSILAHDPVTGEFGVASASHAPLIGVNLDFLDPAVGGVIVHGGPHLAINRKVLTALGDSLAPATAIKVGLVGVPDRERLQVLATSALGTAAFTGERAEERAAQEIRELSVAAGQRLEDPGVPAAMQDAFEASDGPLADRLLIALKAGRDAGGETGGAHSAALLVVGPGARFATRGRLVDLRVDFVPGDAVAALDRLRAQVDSVYEV